MDWDINHQHKPFDIAPRFALNGRVSQGKQDRRAGDSATRMADKG